MATPNQPGVFHRWHRIQDVSDYVPLPRRTDMDVAAARWQEQRAVLGSSEAIETFEEQLCNEWAIETGQIERLYVLTRGTTEVLISAGFDRLESFTSADRVTAETPDLLRDQKDTLELVFSFVRDERELSVSYIRELHQLLCRHQGTYDAIDPFGRQTKRELARGVWKTLPNSVRRPDGRIHEYCPPEHVASEMDRLVALHRRQRDLGLPVVLQSAWLHLAFAQIHPFQDGNGRVARALATMVFLKAGMLPLVIRDAQRGTYIRALEAGDAGRLDGLVNLFADTVISDTNRAIVFAGGHVTEDIEAIATAAAARSRALDAESPPDALQPAIGGAIRQLRSIASRLEQGFSAAHEQLSTEVRAGNGLAYSRGSESRIFWVRLDLHVAQAPDSVPDLEASLRVVFEPNAEDGWTASVLLRQIAIDANGPARYGSFTLADPIAAETVARFEAALEPMVGAALRDWAANR